MRLNMYIRNPKMIGITSIYFTITWGRRLIYQVGESIHTSEWNNKKYEPKQNAENAGLIGRLAKAEQKVRDAFEKLENELGVANITPQLLRDAINKKTITKSLPEKKQRMLITAFFQQFIDDTKAGKRKSINKLIIKQNSIKPYGSSLSSFEKFEEHVGRKFYLTHISQQLIEDFEDYLSNILGLALNTKSTYLKKFGLMVDYAIEKKLIDKGLELNWQGMLGAENSDSIYLTDAEIEDLMNYNKFSNPTHEVVRDLFVAACKTGLRYSDFSNLTKEQIRNGNIYVLQSKTKAKVTIPIHPIAQRIFDKYAAGFPSCPTNQPFNDYLKEIGKNIPSLKKQFMKKITKGGQVKVEKYEKWQLLQSHSARRTYCTLEHMKGTPIFTIMAISGHKDVKVFKNYVKSSGEENAEIMRNAWRERGEV
jgi:integrase